MTKEELEKEAEEYANNLLFVYETDVVQRIVRERVRLALIDVLEPREKRIAELEKENKTVSRKANEAIADKLLITAKYNEVLNDLNQENDKLQKENTQLKAQIEKMKKYGKLLQDICDVMGNDPYMVWRGLEQRVLILWDRSEEEKGLKMAKNILDRLLKIKPQDWAEIDKWEIKEK